MDLFKQAGKKILIVEDDVGLQKQMKWCFDGYDVLFADNREEALQQFIAHQPDVVMLDLGLPPDQENASEGLATLGEMLEVDSTIKVIVVTGNNDKDNSLKAIALGAYDFYQKPIDPELLKFSIGRAIYLRELEIQNRELLTKGPRTSFGGMIFVSSAMQKVCKTIEKVAPTDISVLVLGDSGTGKELLARALHDMSLRRNKRFVAINCAAIPENLLESELFGYEKGAFTGAVKQTIGKIECANGGTLFLDEIGDLGQPLTAKLLRFLQERVIERLGGRKEIPVDVRVVCATHQDIPGMVESGHFREDLYYRISEITINVPPLSDRREDIMPIAQSFIERLNLDHARKIKGLSKGAVSAMEAYSWPGNVRELENKVKRAVIMAEGQLISAEDLDLTASEVDDASLELKVVREEAELLAVQRALSMFNNNVTKAAGVLGVSRPTLYALMNKFGIK